MSLARELSQEQVHYLLEKHFKEEALHQNRQEHTSSPIVFVLRILLFGVLGIVLGGLINALFGVIQSGCTHRGKTIGFLVLQILILAVLFWLASWVLGQSTDDWVMATWSGFLFALTFFASQTHLNGNIQCAIGQK